MGVHKQAGTPRRWRAPWLRNGEEGAAYLQNTKISYGLVRTGFRSGIFYDKIISRSLL